MRSAKKIQWAFFFLMPFLFVSAAFALPDVTDDYTPDVTARVARISFISGDVQIKRADQTDWERATQNLPIVEGDEIATDSNARLEIQFNSYTFLRLSANAYLKVTTLRDEGIAVSLPEGTMSLRVLNFDKDRAYFEIDAPKTTVSVEEAGMYRVDAGSKNDSEVRVSVTDSGQARVYSENSGFTLRNGRSAVVQIDGDYAGEWETSEAARYTDDFDEWALQRDAVIAKRLQDADYDKYYDRDIYGAEDLSEYGEWVFTKKYGYVWKPYRNSTASYSDWSPYRYGQWRWIPPYGWTWVNDEPWGWATYHHGRWVYDNGWYWSPYSQNRARRSWWHPALVVISHIGNSVCWYPLPYSYGYYNYNSYYNRRNRNTTVINNNTTVIVNPTPTTPVVPPRRNTKAAESLVGLVPRTGVVTVELSGFGRDKKGFMTAPIKLADEVLATAPLETVKQPPLPNYQDLKGRISKDILVETPRNTKIESNIKTGATERIGGISIGETLRKERMLGNRPPLEKNDRTPQTQIKSENNTQSPIRDTGAITRQPRQVVRQNDGNQESNEDSPIKVAPDREPIRSTRSRNEDEKETRNPVKTRRNDDRESLPQTYNPPKQEEPRVREPVRERQPEPIRQPEPVRQPEPTRQEPPPRSEPTRQEPPPRSEPVKQEPPPEVKQLPTEVRSKTDKDG